MGVQCDRHVRRNSRSGQCSGSGSRERTDRLRRHRNENLSEVSKPASRETLQIEKALSSGSVLASKRSLVPQRNVTCGHR